MLVKTTIRALLRELGATRIVESINTKGVGFDVLCESDGETYSFFRNTLDKTIVYPSGEKELQAIKTNYEIFKKQ